MTFTKKQIQDSTKQKNANAIHKKPNPRQQQKQKTQMTSTKNKTPTFKKGDFLIDFGQVFKITQVKNIKNDSGSDKLLVFTPYFKKNNDSDITSSLPLSNLDKTTIRSPLSKKEANTILKILSDKKIKLEVVDVLTAKGVLNQNDPTIVAQTIRKLFLEKNSKDKKFTSSKKYIYQMLITRLAEEIALIYKISLEKAQTKIENKLKK